MKQVTLREARRRRRLTQQQLEAASGVSQAVISRIERGTRLTPTFHTVVKLSKALDIDPRSLKFGVVPNDVAVAS